MPVLGVGDTGKRPVSPRDIADLHVQCFLLGRGGARKPLSRTTWDAGLCSSEERPGVGGARAPGPREERRVKGNHCV